MTARDLELPKGITNSDYHYKGSGIIMAKIGKAFAEAIHGLGEGRWFAARLLKVASKVYRSGTMLKILP